MTFSRLSRLLSAALIATVVASPLTLWAQSGGAPKFQAEFTEDFWFFGCPDGVDPNAVDTCGSGKAHPFGHFLIGTLITGFSPLPSGCFLDSHTSTLDFGEKGVVVAEIEGELCPTGGPNFEFLGSYHITGGTGIFTESRGDGVVTAYRDNGPIQVAMDGVISLQQGGGLF